MRRLADLPGVDALELKALMKPRIADPDERHDHPEVDAVAVEAFGLTLDQAEATALPADWPDHLKDLHRQSPAQLVEAFEAEGWDVTDKKRKPLRVLPLFALPLALAARGVAGTLPFMPEPDHPETGWGAGLKAEAGRFRTR
ncbi:hypothetical protein GCM10009116_06230 [Brevundimonas basaltis]|uniref:Uncharacterized protein n=1 Tax=Brevundimonas basaltis TaxID=472166 RepID=A0A7W8I0A4_9CAUL|nr:hypothetical protein [Brevundimonas basaltis]MBB5293166.1 hypothetical protein [Brevundimonas basaltis]